jgi:hypothetical protein
MCSCFIDEISLLSSDVLISCFVGGAEFSPFDEVGGSRNDVARGVLSNIH